MLARVIHGEDDSVVGLVVDDELHGVFSLMVGCISAAARASRHRIRKAGKPFTASWGGHNRKIVARLALQLRFHVSALCLSLMDSSPEGPCNNEVWLDSFSSEARGDAADFLHGPADERSAGQRRVGLSVFALRRIVFGGGAIVLA